MAATRRTKILIAILVALILSIASAVGIMNYKWGDRAEDYRLRMELGSPEIAYQIYIEAILAENFFEGMFYTHKLTPTLEHKLKELNPGHGVRKMFTFNRHERRSDPPSTRPA